MKTRLSLFFMVAFSGPALSATFVVESFNEGEFALSGGGSNSAINSPLGTQRAQFLNNRNATPGTVLSANVDTGAGHLMVSFNGQSTLATRPLDFNMSYLGGGPFDLSGFSAFEFDFTALAGTGFLVIELGRESDSYGPATKRVALNGVGTLSVPFNELNFGSGTIDIFGATHFTFEAESEQFSFTLDEIRVVPEPSAMALVCFGVLAGLCRRSRPAG